MSSTIFLSTVTAEFGVLRTRLARLLERTKRVHIRHQDDFVHRGVLTLQKLEEEIEASDIVVHAIGAKPGSTAPADQAQELLDRRTDIRIALPQAIAQHAREGRLTYTQWEAWLAIALRKRLCCYRLADRELEPSQLFQAEHLAGCKFYPDSVANDDALYDTIISSLLALGVLTQQEVHRPIKLPYQTLGALFKGREGFLKQLRESLTKAIHHRAAIVGKAIHGLGGVGKTRLAVEYAWQHQEEYSALLFVTADTSEALHRNLADLAGAQVLNLPEQEVQEEEKKVAAALRWLQQNPGWFLIIDNVDTEEAATHVEELLTKLHGGHVLITSRLQKWGNEVETLELDVLEEHDAADLMLERTSKARDASRCRKEGADDPQLAVSLARELDGLALALEQASAFICQRRISLADYLALWRSHLPEVKEAFDGRISKYPRSVAVTWRTTLDQLSASEIALLNFFAWFAPEPIPASVLDQVSKSTLTPLVSGDVESNLKEWLGRLADYSMIRWNHEASTVVVHRVVQEILRTQQEAPALFLEAAISVLDRTRQAAGIPSDVRTWPVWDSIQLHLSSVINEAIPYDIVVPTNRLMNGLAILFASQVKFAEAEQLYRRCLEMSERVLGSNHAEVATCQNNLAALLEETNRLSEAEILYRRSLAIFERLYGPDHPDVATTLSNLAGLLRETNRLAEARTLLERSLDIFESTLGENHPNVAQVLNKMSRVMNDASQAAQEEPLLRRALAICEGSLGPEHPEVALTLNNLALVFRNTNRLAEAEPLFRRALSIEEHSLGPEHPDVAAGLNNLAELLHATMRFAEAEAGYRRALAIREKAYGADHPEVAASLNNLGSLLHDTGGLDEAESLIRRALAIWEQSYGPHHPLVGASLNNLAGLLESTKRLEESEPLFRRALAIWEQALGPDDLKVSASLNNLATVLWTTGRLSEAEVHFRRALAIRERCLDANHQDVRSSLSNLAFLLWRTQHFEEAEALMRRALLSNEVSNGFNHPSVATSLKNLAGLLCSMGKHTMAEPLLRRALSICEQSLEPNDPEIATSLNDLAVVLCHTNQLMEAEPVLRRCLEIRQQFERQSGFPHSDLARTEAAYRDLLEKINAAKKK